MMGGDGEVGGEGARVARIVSLRLVVEGEDESASAGSGDMRVKEGEREGVSEGDLRASVTFTEDVDKVYGRC